MERNESAEGPSFWERVTMAFRLIFNAAFGREVDSGLKLLQEKAVAPVTLPPERVHASGLFVLAALQREGRLIDFLQQDVAGFSDEEVGAAARVVHAGCKRVLKQYFDFEPAVEVSEGSTMAIPTGFDAQRIRLAGNVTGQPPFKGVLKHHGWVANQVRLPAVAETLDPKVVAPAEVELP